MNRRMEYISVYINHQSILHVNIMNYLNVALDKKLRWKEQQPVRPLQEGHAAVPKILFSNTIQKS